MLAIPRRRRPSLTGMELLRRNSSRNCARCVSSAVGGCTGTMLSSAWCLRRKPNGSACAPRRKRPRSNAGDSRSKADARLELKAQRLADVIAAARSDTSFWEALRKWEHAREAKRPPQSPPVPVRSTPGAIILGRVSAERQAILDNPPVDPIFAEFIARVGIPDDPLTVREFVSNLRYEMRRELGMDRTVQWPGGPASGVSS